MRILCLMWFVACCPILNSIQKRIYKQIGTKWIAYPITFAIAICVLSIPYVLNGLYVCIFPSE